jgi:ketosteroid isomerase-like protein
MRELAKVFPLIVALGCAAGDTAQSADKASGEDPAAVQQAIDQINAEFVAGLKAGDAAKLAGYYDAEGMAMPPNMPAATGVAEIQKTLGDFLGAVTVQDFKLTTTNLLVKDDIAVETGTSVMTMQPKAAGAPAVTENGKYVVVWRKQADGSWKLYRDIFNSSDPMPTGK